MINPNDIKALATEFLPDVVAVRRHMHTHPELSFQEFETSAYIQSKLTEWGIPFKNNIVKTGIVATIEGKNPQSKTIALRADIDALPIVEENDVPYKSVNTGVMHACGHDAHTSSLMGAARILNTLKDDFDGTVRMLFQPGEERIPGGAKLMIEEGVLDNPRPHSILGQHVLPQLQAGKVGFKGGMFMASADEIYVTVHGKGGHGAMPHLAIDPVLIAAHIVVALQQVVSRRSNPLVPTVLTFGKVLANGSTNIIPNEVYMEGTFRTMNEEWRAKAHEIMKTTAESLAQSMGATCEFKILKGYPFLVNDEEVTNRARQGAIEFLGAENVVELESRMTAEDFAYYTQLMPACFYRLGTGNAARNITSGIHTPTFDIDESSLETGMGLMAYLAVKELAL
jgi:amidohydrolase